MSNPKVSKEERQICSSQVEQLERENARLAEQLKEVIKMNTHWQRYDSQREEYVLKLTRTNQELQDKESDLQRQVRELSMAKENEANEEHPKPKETHPARGNKTGDGDELKALQEEERVAALADCIAKLKERIAELEKGREARKKADDDQLAVLREQINVCVEDFEQERRDRERIHGENERLREQLADAERCIMENEERIYVYQEQIKRLQQRGLNGPVVQPSRANGYEEPCCCPEDRHHRVRTQVYVQNAYRHPLYFGDDLTDLPGDVEIDGVKEQVEDHYDGGKSIIVDGASEDTNSRKQDDNPRANESILLECPRCMASFGQHEHDHFLRHIDKCVQ